MCDNIPTGVSICATCGEVWCVCEEDVCDEEETCGDMDRF